MPATPSPNGRTIYNHFRRTQRSDIRPRQGMPEPGSNAAQDEGYALPPVAPSAPSGLAFRTGSAANVIQQSLQALDHYGGGGGDGTKSRVVTSTGSCS